MSDPMTMAKSAREALARALAALQADSTVPPELSAVAEPVSQGMGALFQIERSQGAAWAEHLPSAVDAVRRALAMLQAQPSQHVAVGTAMEAVAGALGLVHGLTRLAADKPKEPSPPQPVVMHSPPQPAVQVQAPVQAQAPPAQERRKPATTIPDDADRVEVALGTNSVSNLYRGLDGDDVIEHGGIFVATYNVLPIGQQLALRVLFPGGYELEASGIVHWIRQARGVVSQTSETMHPGYGVRFLQLSDEGRALVARYARNREPIFYDDP